MYIALKIYKKVFTFLLFRNLKQMSLSGDTGSRYCLCSKKKEIFSSMYGYTALQRKNLSSHYIINTTQLRLGNQFETIIMSYKNPPFPCTFDECNDLPTCRTTQTCKEEAEISLQVSLALQKKKMCLLSKLHKAVRKWSRSQKNNPDYFTTDFVMDSSS